MKHNLIATIILVLFGVANLLSDEWWYKIIAGFNLFIAGCYFDMWFDQYLDWKARRK